MAMSLEQHSVDAAAKGNYLSHMTTGAAPNVLNAAAVAAPAATILGWLQGNIGMVASALSAIWIGLQIIVVIQNQIDRRRMAKLRDKEQVHATIRADGLASAIINKDPTP